MTSVGRVLQLLGTRCSSGLTLVAGLVAVAVGLVTASFLDMAPYVPGWANVFNIMLTSTIFLAPIAAGAAAAEGIDLRRRGVLQWARTAPAGRHRLLLLSGVSLSLWFITALTALCVVVNARLGTAGAPTAATLLLPILASVLLVTVVMLGLAVGLRVDSIGVAPLMAFLIFAPLYLAPYARGRLAAYSLVFSGTYYQPWMEPRAALVADQVVLLCACLTLAIATTVARRQAAVLLFLAVILGTYSVHGLGRVSTVPYQTRAATSNAACMERSGISLCVWPSARPALGPGLQALVAYVQAAEPYLSVPRAYRQPGLATHTNARVLELPADVRSRDEAAPFASAAVLSSYTCSRGPGFRASADLFTWLVARAHPAGADSASTATLVASASPATQRQWVDAQLDRIRRCGR